MRNIYGGLTRDGSSRIPGQVRSADLARVVALTWILWLVPLPSELCDERCQRATLTLGWSLDTGRLAATRLKGHHVRDLQPSRACSSNFGGRPLGEVCSVDTVFQMPGDREPQFVLRDLALHHHILVDNQDSDVSDSWLLSLIDIEMTSSV